MILQALVKRYHMLVADPDSDMAPPHYSRDKVSFILVLNTAGEIVRVESIRYEDARKKLRPAILTVPEHTARSGTGSKPYYLSDKAEYVLGLVKQKDGTLIVSKRFQSSRQLHLMLLKDKNGPEATALKNFYMNWNPETQLENPSLKAELDMILGTTDNNLAFQLEGYDLMHKSGELLEPWEQQDQSQDEESVILGSCLVTGETSVPIARVHDIKIKGVQNTNSAGASLVSFNFDATESYGKTQSYNAPVSQVAVSAYTKALNDLLSSQSNTLRHFGEMTVAYWAERQLDSNAWRLQEGIFSHLVEGDGFQPQDEGKEEETKATAQIRDLLKRVQSGKAISHTLPNESSFYILGLSGNNARISVRYFWQGSFGDLLVNLNQYQEDLYLQRVGNQPEQIPGIFRIMLETVRKVTDFTAMKKSVSSSMESQWFRSMVEGRGFPYTVYASIVNRIRTDGIIHPFGENGRSAWIRASVIKGYLTRNERIRKQDKYKEALGMSVNKDAPQVSYRLGRLFAVLEKIQSDSANGRLNVTIKKSFFASAAATPGTVFPRLLKLSNSHLSKLSPNIEIWWNKLIREIMGEIKIDQHGGGIPKRLNLEEQGVFMLGYFQQMQDLYTSKSSEGTPVVNDKNNEGVDMNEHND